MGAKKAAHKSAGNNLPNDFRQYYCAKTSDERHKKQISLGLIRTCNQQFVQRIYSSRQTRKTKFDAIIETKWSVLVFVMKSNKTHDKLPKKKKRLMRCDRRCGFISTTYRTKLYLFPEINVILLLSRFNVQFSFIVPSFTLAQNKLIFFTQKIEQISLKIVRCPHFS